MKLYLIRHGETIQNATGIIQGQMGGELSNQGIQQCEKVAKRLAHHSFDAIYCSDLKRTKDSLEIIMKENNWKNPIHYTTLLREMGRGIFEGGPHENYFKAREESGLNWWEYQGPKGESVMDLYQRITTFLEKLENESQKEVLIMAHGGSIKTIIANMLGTPPQNAIRNIVIHNTGITKIEKREKKWIIHYVNDNQHTRGKPS